MIEERGREKNGGVRKGSIKYCKGYFDLFSWLIGAESNFVGINSSSQMIVHSKPNI